MGRFAPISIRRLRGLNEDHNPEVVGDDELTRAFNSWRRGETTGTRPGTERDADDFTAQGAGAVNGGVDFRKSNDATRNMVIVCNGAIRVGDGGTTPTGAAITGAVTVTAGANHRWTFAQHAGNLYGAGGTSTDSFWKYTGSGNASAISMLDLSSAAIYPSYVFEKWNRLWTAGFRAAAGGIATDLSSNPMTVRFSALSDGDVWPIGNTIGGTGIGGLSAYGNEYVTGFGEFQGTLLILTNRRIYQVLERTDPFAPFAIGREEQSQVAVGCVHQNAFVNLGLDSGDAIFLSRHGVHSMRQSKQFGQREDAFLSWKIRETFSTINKSTIQRSVATYWPEEGVVLFAVPTGSSANPDLILCLDIKGKDQITAGNAEWHIWERTGASADAALTTAFWYGRSSSSTGHVYEGNAAGDVTKIVESTTADLSAAYVTDIVTKHNDYGQPTMDKGLGDITVVLQPGGTHSPMLTPVFDNGARGGTPIPLTMGSVGPVWDNAIFDSDVFPTDTGTFTDKVYGRGRGRTIAFQFQHGAANEPFYIASIHPQVRLFGETTGDN
jgi:hypothetical protein